MTAQEIAQWTAAIEENHWARSPI